jgi:hypothetical protein
MQRERRRWGKETALYAAGDVAMMSDPFSAISCLNY